MCVQVSQWTSSCLEHCIKRLTALNKPFKYVVTCVIMQKNGEPWLGCGRVHVGGWGGGAGDRGVAHPPTLPSWLPMTHDVPLGRSHPARWHPPPQRACATRLPAPRPAPQPPPPSPTLPPLHCSLLLQARGYTRPRHAGGTALRTAAGLCAGRTRPCEARGGEERGGGRSSRWPVPCGLVHAPTTLCVHAALLPCTWEVHGRWWEVGGGGRWCSPVCAHVLMCVVGVGVGFGVWVCTRAGSKASAPTCMHVRLTVVDKPYGFGFPQVPPRTLPAWRTPPTPRPRQPRPGSTRRYCICTVFGLAI